jgi:hypothetical protein
VKNTKRNKGFKETEKGNQNSNNVAAASVTDLGMHPEGLFKANS